MITIEAGTPFADVLAAVQDTARALELAVAHTRDGREGLVSFDLWQVEDALERAYKALNVELLARNGGGDDDF